MKLVSIQTSEQVAEYKRGEESAPFECTECGYRAYITLRSMEGHSERCTGRKPKITKKRRTPALNT